MSGRSFYCRFLAVLLVAGLPGMAFAQALADHAPADSMIYVGWRGVESLGPGYPGSNLKSVLDQTQIQQFLDEFLPRLADRLAQENPDAAHVLGVLRSVGGPMWRHPSAFFFAGVDFSNPNQPMPHLGLICDAGNESAALQQQVQALIQQVGGLPVPLNVIRSGNVVAVLVGYANPEGVLGGGKGLAGDASFIQALGQVSKDAVTTIYINFESLINLVDKVVQLAAPEQVKNALPNAERALGLHGLKHLMISQGFEGKEWGTQVFLSAPEPRQGLLATLDQAKPLSNDIYATIPENVRVAGATHFDLGGLVSAIQSAAAQVDPNAGQMIDAVFQQISQAVGVDVRKDLFGSLGDEWAAYIDPTVLGRSMLSVTVVNHLKDPAKADEAILKVHQFVAQAISQQVPDKKMMLTIEQTHVGDVTVHYVGLPIIAPSWAVSNGNLYIGLYPQVVGAAAMHGAGHGKSILDNKSFMALREKLNGKNAVSFQFMDLPQLVPDSYGGWTAITRLGGFGDLLGVPAPPMVLPTLDKIMPYMAASGAVSWVDAQGVHAHALEPFPGSEALATDPMGVGPAQEAMLVSILLPALNKAREQANRVKSASNLRQIGLGARMYANEQKNGALPADLGTIFEKQDMGSAVFINPRSKTSLPGNFGSMTKEQQKQWVSENSDYMWFGAGKTNAAPADTVIASEKPEGMNDGLNMLFGDGHVEFISPMAEAQKRIQDAESGRGQRRAGTPRGRMRGAGRGR